MHNDEFDNKLGLRLENLISAHKACLVRLGQQTESAVADEIEARSQIMLYEPRDRREALERLGYLFALAATANDWLEDDTIGEFLATIRND